MTTQKRPSFQWYPGDWQRDMALRTCSIAARGLWTEMLNLMHEGTPYGHLSINGQPLTDEEAAIACAVSLREYRKLRGELEQKGVFTRDPETDVIFSRRMVRDEIIRLARAAGGAEGGPHGWKGGRKKKPLPEPLQGVGERGYNGNPPASAVASAVASASAVSSQVGSSSQQGDATDQLRRLLTIAANKGSQERFGDGVLPVFLPGHGGTYRCAEAVLGAGVDPDFAAAVLYGFAKKHPDKRPPHSMHYFTDRIIERWHQEVAKQQAATYQPTAEAAETLDMLAFHAAKYAQQGDEEYQRYCDERGITWRAAS